MDEKLKELLKSLNQEGNEIITEDFIKELDVIFKAKLIEAKEEGKQEAITEAEEKSAEEAKGLKEEFEEDAKEFKAEMLEDADEFKNKVIDTLDQYIDKFAGEFIAENKDDIVDAIEVQKAKHITEKFQEFVSDFGHEITDERLEESVKESEYKDKYNQAVNENITLKKQIDEIDKNELIESVAGKLEYASEQDKFKSIAGKFTFKTKDSFLEDLNTLANNFDVVQSKLTEEDELQNSERQTITESISDTTETSKNNPLDVFRSK